MHILYDIVKGPTNKMQENLQKDFFEYIDELAVLFDDIEALGKVEFTHFQAYAKATNYPLAQCFDFDNQATFYPNMKAAAKDFLLQGNLGILTNQTEEKKEDIIRLGYINMPRVIETMKRDYQFHEVDNEIVVAIAS